MYDGRMVRSSRALMMRCRVSSSFGLSAFALWLACSGTETDNPVVASGDGSGDYSSPDEFGPHAPPPPCPLPDEDGLGPPQGLPRGLLLQLPDQPPLLAQGGDGLELWDLTHSANPTLLSRRAVRG